MEMKKGMENPGKGKTAEGCAMGASVPKVGENPSKTNDQQPVPSNTSFGVKSLSFKKVQSGY